MAIWLYGYVATWLYGYMALRLLGYLAMWLYGYKAIWLYGYMAIWSCYRFVIIGCDDPSIPKTHMSIHICLAIFFWVPGIHGPGIYGPRTGRLSSEDWGLHGHTWLLLKRSRGLPNDQRNGSPRKNTNEGRCRRSSAWPRPMGSRYLWTSYLWTRYLGTWVSR